MVEPVVGAKKRSWGKIIALVLVGVFFVGVLGVVGLLQLVTGSMKRSGAYRQAFETAAAHPLAVDALGEPIEAGWWVSGSVEASGPGGEASLAIPVSGPVADGKLFAQALKSAGSWELTSLVLEVDGGSPVDLLAAPAADPAASAAPAAPAQDPGFVAAVESTNGAFSVHVRRQWSSNENPLYTELHVNDDLVNIFTSDTWEPVGVQPGWNRISLVTEAQEPASDENSLQLRFGPMYEQKDGGVLMQPVLWLLRNGDDWRLDNGRMRHPLGPDVKSVRLDYELYYAGLDLEGREIAAGDYVLQGRPQWSSNGLPMTATVVVNGTPLTSFTLEDRQVVVTPLLVEGKNEIRLISRRVRDAIEENDLKFLLAGPAEWNVGRNEYVMKPVVQFNAMQGWQRDPDTGQLVHAADPEAQVIERVIPFVLKTAPGASAG